jgi:hypothetical protein
MSDEQSNLVENAQEDVDEEQYILAESLERNIMDD